MSTGERSMPMCNNDKTQSTDTPIVQPSLAEEHRGTFSNVDCECAEYSGGEPPSSDDD